MNKTINKITSVALSATTVVWLTGAAALMPIAANAQSVQDQIQSLLAQIATLQAQLSSMQGSTATTSSVSCNFTRSLTMGSKGDDVKCLQKYLNSAGHQLASSGAGSPGNETTYFGSITKAGVIKWQNANASTVLAPVGLSVGTGYFGPSSRSAYASMVTSTPVVTPVTPGTTGVPSGSLTYSLAADNPASSNIPKGASEVAFMKLAVSGSGTVDSLKFKRTGLGATADFVSSGVKLYEGSTRLTTGKSVNGTSHEVIFPNLKLDVSGLRTIALTSDISSSATAGNINAFELIEINGEALASPIKGNSMNIGGASVGTVTVAKVGSQPSNPTVGEVGAKLTEFKVTAGTVEDVEVRRIVLTDTGSITNGYLTNLVMRQAGNVVATTAGVTGRDMFVFELDSPFKVLKGQNRSFEVLGDISPLAKKDDTVDLYMDLTNDANVTGLTYGYGVTVTNSFTSSLNHSALTLQGAEITITFNGPNARDIAKDAQDVTLFDFSIATKNNVEIKSIGLLTSTTGLTLATEGFADFKLVDAATGAAVTTSVDIANNTSSTQTFTDVINIAAGTTRRFLATADVDTNNPADSTIKVTLTQFAGTDIRNLDNNQDVAIADIVPNAKIVGNAQTVKTPGLALTLAGSPPAHNIVGGNTNEKLLGFNLKASSGDIKVTQVAISVDAGTGTDAQAQNDLRTIGLYVDNQLISEKKNLSSITSANQATFSQVNYTVPDGQTKTVEVRADLVATDATSANVYFAYLTNTDVTATDADGNSVTPSGTNINGSVGSAGSITVTVATPSIQIVKVNNTVTEAGIVTPGEQTLAQWDFFAKEAEAQINKLRIGVASTTTIDSSSHDSLAQEIKEIRLYDGSTLLGSGVPAASGTDAGVIKLENSSGIVTIPANTTKQLTVKAVLGDCADSTCSSYTLKGLSGQSTSTDNLVAFIATSTNFEAVSGNTTITSITSSDGEEVGNVKRLYKSLPTITVSSPSSSILSTGEIEALKFTIAADSSGDIEVGRLEINVVTSIASITANTVTIRSGGVDIAESSTIANLVDVAGGADGIIEFTTPERITAGTSKTYSLFLDVTAVSSGSDSLVTKLKGDATDYVTPETFAINSQGTNSFVWSDMAGSSGSPHSTSTTDWHNGFNLKTLPSGAKGLTKS